MSQFALRVPDHILEQARIAAREDNISMNQLLSALIAEGLGHRRGLRMMRQRARRADPEAALRLLDTLSSSPVEEGDEMPERRS